MCVILLVAREGQRFTFSRYVHCIDELFLSHRTLRQFILLTYLTNVMGMLHVQYFLAQKVCDLHYGKVN